jgi:hypothetical protein
VFEPKKTLTKLLTLEELLLEDEELLDLRLFFLEASLLVLVTVSFCNFSLAEAEAALSW